jgi:hypothetical protein
MVGTERAYLREVKRMTALQYASQAGFILTNSDICPSAQLNDFGVAYIRSFSGSYVCIKTQGLSTNSLHRW